MTSTLKKSYLIAGLILIIFWGFIALVVYNRFTASPSTQAACNDFNCTNFKSGTNWAIRNCSNTTSSEGSLFICSKKGDVGTCQNTSYCCPGEGSLWTKDMTQCGQVSPTPGCCACPTPTPYMMTSQCNGPCMGNGNCPTGNICIFQSGFGWVCRNPACYSNTSCSCSTAASQTSTPTPTTTQKYFCGEPCLSSSECQSDLRCVYVNNTKECRNPQCPNTDTCLCIN